MKHTLHRIYFFMQPVYKTQIVLGEKYVSIEQRKTSSVTMPSDISYANFVLMFFVSLS